MFTLVLPSQYQCIVSMCNDFVIALTFLFQSLAVLVLLSVGQFVRVVELLHQMRHFDRAALFVEACQQFQLLDSSSETSILRRL